MQFLAATVFLDLSPMNNNNLTIQKSPPQRLMLPGGCSYIVQPTPKQNTPQTSTYKQFSAA